MTVQRGCGTRVKGGIYAETLLGTTGMPVSYFLIDPPIPVNPEEIGVSSVGVKLFEREGVWHLFDWVGSTHYPNVSDFIEEMMRFGMSRRLPANLPFGKLSSESKVFLIHARAHIEDYNLYTRGKCPKGMPAHKDNGMCLGLCWRDHDGGDGEEYTREMPSFAYQAWRRLKAIKAEHQPAIFAAMPITQLAVIRDDDNDSHEDALLKAKRAKLQVELKEE